MVQWITDPHVSFGLKVFVGFLAIIVLIAFVFVVWWTYDALKEGKTLKFILRQYLVTGMQATGALILGGGGVLLVLVVFFGFFGVVIWGSFCGFQGPMLECVAKATSDARYP